MATAVFCNQVAEKWQQSFARLNRDKEGISGLLEFSEVRVIYLAGHSLCLFKVYIVMVTRQRPAKTARTRGLGTPKWIRSVLRGLK